MSHCFPASGLEAVGCPEPYHVFGIGWRKVLGFFASASHTLSLNYPVMLSSCIQNESWVMGRKEAVPGKEKTWLPTMLTGTAWFSSCFWLEA